MTPVELLVVGAALGLVIGMLGGGGGVLAVPMLVAFGELVLSASTMSLVIVGTGAAAALVPHHRAGRVDWRIGLTFGALGAVGAVVGARIASHVPAGILLGGFSVLVFLGAGAMLAAGRRARRQAVAAASGPVDDEHLLLDAPEPHPRDAAPAASALRRFLDPRTVVLASAVGLVTGLFGVGAGFVVVPALVAAMKVPIKKATATALVVIVMNSAVAFAAKADNLRGSDVPVVLELAAITAAFAVAGALVSRRVPAWVLSFAFGTLLIGVALYTVVKAVTI